MDGFLPSIGTPRSPGQWYYIPEVGDGHVLRLMFPPYTGTRQASETMCLFHRPLRVIVLRPVMRPSKMIPTGWVPLLKSLRRTSGRLFSTRDL